MSERRPSGLNPRFRPAPLWRLLDRGVVATTPDSVDGCACGVVVTSRDAGWNRLRGPRDDGPDDDLPADPAPPPVAAGATNCDGAVRPGPACGVVYGAFPGAPVGCDGLGGGGCGGLVGGVGVGCDCCCCRRGEGVRNSLLFLGFAGVSASSAVCAIRDTASPSAVAGSGVVTAGGGVESSVEVAAIAGGGLPGAAFEAKETISCGGDVCDDGCCCCCCGCCCPCDGRGAPVNSIPSGDPNP